MTTTTQERKTPGRTLYRVSPEHEGGWLIELAGDSVQERAAYKGEAIARARELAAQAPIGAVAVYDRDGRLEQEFDVESPRPD